MTLASPGFRQYALSSEAEVVDGFGGTSLWPPMNRDIYQALGLDPNASCEQIRAAYKYWAEELQPLPDSPVNEGLRELQDAYSALAHPRRRRAYDARLRQEHLPPRKSETFRPLGPATPVRAAPVPRDISLCESFDSFHPSFAELFDRFWSNFDSVIRPKAERLESLTIDVPLTPDEAHAGGAVRVLVPARAQCSACAGHGALGDYQCWHCGGHGSITANYPVEISYPAGLLSEYIVRVSLSEFGIRNFYLIIRFRVAGQP
jgi:molecular chaperone DnaJ